MQQLEVTTPVLKESIEIFRAAIDGTKDATEARTHIAAGNGLVRAVGQELKVRMAMPRLAAVEAKLIEAARQETLPDKRKPA